MVVFHTAVLMLSMTIQILIVRSARVMIWNLLHQEKERTK